MSSFIGKQLLWKLARCWQQQYETVSRLEIVKKINEIKYLASHKKIPKLSLRREIEQVEQKLRTLVDLEKQVLKQKRQESTKVMLLKKQLTSLKLRLSALEDKDLQKRMEKLSFFLGDLLARKGTEEEVKKVEETLGKRLNVVLPVSKEEKIKLLEKKSVLLKELLENVKMIPTQDPDKAAMLEVQIERVQEKLKELKGEVPVGEVKHTLLFDTTLAKPMEMALERELPLPPPPKVEK